MSYIARDASEARPSGDPRYPIGKFLPVDEMTEAERGAAIEAIAGLPDELRMAIDGLSGDQLDTPYREGGWSVRQVVHHVADSHLNAYTRFKLGLTESEPTIRPYDEARWAELADAKGAEPEVSLKMLEGLHVRWVTTLRSLEAGDFTRTVLHPEIGVLSLETLLGLYAWHGPHHVAHITSLRKHLNW
jgi:uncharacterized damage-inducible protein DinB